MIGTALLALALVLGGGAARFGVFLGAVTAVWGAAGGHADPNGAAAPSDAGTILDPNGAAAESDAGGIYDPNGAAAESDGGNSLDPDG